VSDTVARIATLLGFLVISAVAALLIVGAIVHLLGQLTPVMLLAAAIVVAVCASRRRSAAARVRYRPALPPPVGWGSAPPPGWVLKPVWIGPPPTRASAVIAAEVIEDDRRG
jgi:hypothetical protein